MGNEGDHDESAIWVPTWPPGGQVHQRREPGPVPGGDAQVTMVVGLTCMRGYGRLHLQMQSRYNAGVSTTTVGFAVADEDQERLARLVEHFGGGNRSAYLRATLPVMESLARAERLRELQARNAERAAAAGHDYESLLAEIQQAYKSGNRQR